MNSIFVVPCLVIMIFSVWAEDWSSILDKYKGDVEKIKTFMSMNKGYPYEKLARIATYIGPRMVGWSALDRTINVLKNELEEDGLNPKLEDVQAYAWNEIASTAMFISPKNGNKALRIAAYGPSISGEVEAEILLVKDFDELNKKAMQAKDKIVVYNQDCHDFFECTKYRIHGASKAAEFGALAALTRSISSSLNTTHTGHVEYEGKKKIPAAAITIEDAAYIEKMLNSDLKARIKLNIKTEIEEDIISKNLVVDIAGTESPKEILLSGAHTDSWHVGDGMVNDAVGVNILYESFRVIKNLSLTPKKTLRLALWTAGEQNDKGERDFFKKQQSKSDEKIKLFMKSDRGTFDLSGLIINNGGNFEGLIEAIFSTFFKDWNLVINESITVNDETSEWIVEQKLPRMEFLTNTDKYFSVYNSPGDTLDKILPDEQDRALILWTTIYYIMGCVEY